jgi:hypothetical protein
MLFTNALFAGLATLASAAPALVERQASNDVAPWQITNVAAFKPSGRPNSSPTSTLSVTLSNPNTVRLQKTPTGYAVLPAFKARCRWEWETKSGMPYGVETVCTPVDTDNIYGSLTMKLSPGNGGSSPHGDFGLDIVESRDVTVLQTQYIRVYEGAVKLNTATNLNIVCGGSGVCSWGLKNGAVEVKQELTKSVGSCETASVGGC